jgi:hypothetical protein
MSPASDESRNTEQAPSCKIDRTAAAYDLPLEAERLGEYWTREDDRYSLRELAVYFNYQLLRATMKQNGSNPLDGEVESTYRLLTDEDVSHGMRTQARNRLQKHDIDVEQLQADFISYQTGRCHLKNCLDVGREPTDTNDDPAENAAQRIAAVQHCTAAVTETTLSQLHAAGDIDVSLISLSLVPSVRCTPLSENSSKTMAVTVRNTPRNTIIIAVTEHQFVRNKHRDVTNGAYEY